MGNDKPIEYLKHLFSKKKFLPKSITKINMSKTNKIRYKKKIEGQRRKSLDRKNKLLKSKLYKIKHNRSSLTRGYNYVLRRKN